MRLAFFLSLPALAAAQTLPSLDSVLSNQDAKDLVEREAQSTDAIESLRQTGSEKLYAPGRSKVDAAYGESNPTADAIVIVDRGAAAAGTSEADPTGAIEAARKAVVEGASIEGASDVKTLVGTCRKNTVSVSETSRTETCDVRQSSEGTPASVTESTCARTFYAFTQTMSRFLCTIASAVSYVAEVTVPMIGKTQKTTVLACREGVKAGHDESCRVTRTTHTETLEKAQCLRPRYRLVEQRCVKQLVVRAKATCTPDAETAVEVSDTAYLREDSIPGFDRMRLLYTCSHVNPKAFSVVSNSATGGAMDWSVTIADTVFDIVKTVGNNTVRIAGTRTENDGTATAHVTMRVFGGTGTSTTLSGTLEATLAYKPFRVTQEEERWSETGCEDLP